MNIVELNNYIGNIANQFKLVHHFSTDSVYDVWNNDQIKYGSLVLGVESIRTSTNTTTYNCVIYYGDRLTNDKSNLNDVQTDAVNVLNALIGELQNSDVIVNVELPFTMTLFEQKFADELAGAYVQVSIVTEGTGKCAFDGIINDRFQFKEVVVDKNGEYNIYADPDFVALSGVKLKVDVKPGPFKVASVPGIRFSESYFTTFTNDDFDFTDCESMSHMFQGCLFLTTIPLMNTSSVTRLEYCFLGCESLVEIPVIDTSKVETMDMAFRNCKSLKTVALLDLSNMSYEEHLRYCFDGCESLTNLSGFEGLKISIKIHQSPLLTRQSVLNVIEHVYDFRANGDLITVKTIKLHPNVLALLSESDIKKATDKGWGLIS